MIHGVKEQQDFSTGLKTITTTDDAVNPLNVRRGDRVPQSQVWVDGNSRKSSETTSRSITAKIGHESNISFPVLLSPVNNI